MSVQPVLFIDSGIGGLAYIPSARKKLPKERYIYVADNRYFPYGEKSAETVRERVLMLTGNCIDRFKPKIIVVACNTASVVALTALRKRYSLPFIGVVPAVKPAAKQSKLRKIGIFATNRTVGDVYTENLIREFARDCEIVSYPGNDTVAYIEDRYFLDSEDAKEGYIRKIAEQFLRDGIDSLVLGCTHFVFLADALADYLNGKIEIIDSREGVSRQLKRVVDSLSGVTAESGEDTLYVTKKDGGESVFPIICGKMRIKYKGLLSIGEATPERAKQ